MRTPISNKNYQTGLTFRLKIPRFEEYNYFLQTCSIPALNMRHVDQFTSVNAVPHPGDELYFSDFTIEFKVQEGLRNWYDIYVWMVGLGFPQAHSQFANLKYNRTKDLKGSPYKDLTKNPSTGNVYSDIILLISSSQGSPLLEVTFIDAFPIYLSSVNVTSTDEEVKMLNATASFKYSYFTVTDNV